ncbi:hypothetical protein AVT69_gp045 [Pseudomonas phage PhiPA3]|uniref:Uncharacterized protein 044 n=1 Tax=Pseudomonas phage PhiPA3 TaxID=998086 RepID=F8SJS6_BPPA3|nr:hypothetical protein AVT69_gp045 [Pseudomonas phage PhiPA3]AEH03471.1 hypothetical protein [Pseudomonas phage PhiPA3]
MSNNPEQIVLPEYNVGVMVDHKDIDTHLTRMCDVIRNVALQTFVPKDENDEIMPEDSVKVLLHTCVNEYMQYVFSQPPKVNMPFVNYLDEHFARVAEPIKNDPQKLNYLETKFAQACGAVGNCLIPAANELAQQGYAVEQVQNFHVGYNNTYYVLTGEDFGIEAEMDENS